MNYLFIRSKKIHTYQVVFFHCSKITCIFLTLFGTHLPYHFKHKSCILTLKSENSIFSVTARNINYKLILVFIALCVCAVLFILKREMRDFFNTLLAYCEKVEFGIFSYLLFLLLYYKLTKLCFLC